VYAAAHGTTLARADAIGKKLTYVAAVQRLTFKMIDINTYIKEFVGVTSHCLTEQLGRQISRNRYAFDKSLLVGLLDQNKYEESAAKLRMWKALRWIESGDGHTTRRVYIKEEKKYRRMIVIDLSMYETLMEFVK
jgi:hypothetical protein